METKEINSEGELILQVSGEIDGTNVDEFEKKLGETADRTDRLVLDLGDLEYVSSAGLRVFLTMQKKLRQRGDDMILKNVSSDVMDIFSVTGFVKLLNIKG